MSHSTAEPPQRDLHALISEHSGGEGPLLPMLHAIQAAYGHIPQEAIPLIADALNLTKAEVHGVVTFYHDFRETPAGRHVIKLCRAEACQWVGGAALADRVLGKLGLDWGGTTANGAVTVEAVYCLGLCACGPAAMVDGKVVGRVDDTRMAKILTEAGA